MLPDYKAERLGSRDSAGFQDVIAQTCDRLARPRRVQASLLVLVPDLQHHLLISIIPSRLLRDLTYAHSSTIRQNQPIYDYDCAQLTMASVTTTNSRRDLAAEGDRTPFTNSGAIVADVASKLPSFMQFPLVILLSFSFTFTLYTFASEFTGYELSSLSREVQSDLQIFAAIGWRIAEMAIGWYAGFDGQSPLIQIAVL